MSLEILMLINEQCCKTSTDTPGLLNRHQQFHDIFYFPLTGLLLLPLCSIWSFLIISPAAGYFSESYKEEASEPYFSHFWKHLYVKRKRRRKKVKVWYDIITCKCNWFSCKLMVFGQCRSIFFNAGLPYIPRFGIM